MITHALAARLPSFKFGSPRRDNQRVKNLETGKVSNHRGKTTVSPPTKEH